MDKQNTIPQGIGTGLDAEYVWRYFTDVDSLDPKRVSAHYAEDGTFRFANEPPVTGHAAIEELLANFYGSISSLSHHNTGLWLGDDSAVFEAEAVFTQPDGTTVSLPAVSILRLRDGKIVDFRFVMDASPLSSRSGEAKG